MKYTVTFSAIRNAYAEVEIEAESAQAAEELGWEMLDAGEIELLESDDYIEVDAYEADED